MAVAGEGTTTGAATQGGDASTANPLTSLLGGAGGGGDLTSLFTDAAIGSLAGPAQYLGDGVGRGTTTGLDISNGKQQTSETAPDGVNEVADNLGFGVSNAFAGSLNTSIFTSGAADAAQALGSGLGGGTASGLGLNKSAVAAPTNTTGLPMVAGNLGNGLTQALFSNMDMSKLMGNLTPAQLSSAVVNAGKGLGEGAAEGLKLPMDPATAQQRKMRRADAATTGASGLDTGAVSFGFTKALSSSFLGSVDVKALANQAMSGSNIGNMIGPSVVGAASGFGSGAAQSLGLQKAAVNPATNANTSAPVVAHDFAYDLTTSFLANGTLPALQKQLMSMASGLTSNISSMLGPAAQGAGSGIGQGAAVGLGLQDPNTAQAPMGGDISMTVRDFSFGLTSSFLANGTVSNLAAKARQLIGSNSTMASMLNLQAVSVPKAAEGLARGLVDGGGQSIQNMGGFQRILNGENATAVMMAPAMPIFGPDFDDTTGGVATSFGRGLGSEGVTLVLQLLGKGMGMQMSTNSTSSMSTTSNNLSTPLVGKRSVRNPPVLRRGTSILSKRANTTIASPDLSGILTGVNITSVNVIAQKGVDALTCKGVGGFAQIAAGLKDSGALGLTSNSSVQLPNATFTVVNQGNKFEINPSTGSILVNGVPVLKLTILIVAHAFLVILAFLIGIPFVLLLTNGHEIAVMLGRPHIWAKAEKYRFWVWCIVIMPLGLTGIGLGIYLLGNGRHGTSPHGIMGLIFLVLIIIAFILEFQNYMPRIKAILLTRGIILLVILILSNILFLTGFVDVQRVSLCTVQLPDALLISAALSVGGFFTTGVTVVQVRFLMGRWVGEGGGMMGLGMGMGEREKGVGLERNEGLRKEGLRKEDIRIVRGEFEKFS